MGEGGGGEVPPARVMTWGQADTSGSGFQTTEHFRGAVISCVFGRRHSGEVGVRGGGEERRFLGGYVPRLYDVLGAFCGIHYLFGINPSANGISAPAMLGSLFSFEMIAMVC